LNPRKTNNSPQLTTKAEDWFYPQPTGPSSAIDFTLLRNTPGPPDAGLDLKMVLKISFCLRARIYPCRKCLARNAASAAEVRFLFHEALFQHRL
jgi:hypothetical protein